jgi:quinol monooxygenase YgiN
MIVYRVAVTVHPPAIDAARAMFTRLAIASRAVPGVINFDITQDLTNPARFISIEVYQDQAAVDRQGLLPELSEVMAALGHLAAGQLAGRKFFISRSEPWRP